MEFASDIDTYNQTPADNSKISYKHETFYILFKFANSVKAPKAQIRKNGEKQNNI